MAERNRAAVHVHALRIETELADDLKALRGERLVQFDQVEIADLEARARENLPHGRDRADAHDPRIDARDRARDEAAERLGAQLLRALLARDHERGGAVVHAARIPRRHRPALAERRPKRRELLERRVRPRMLVALDVADRNELVVEAPRLVRRGPAPLALERERVLILAGHRELLGHVLAGLAHRLEREHRLHLRIREPPAERRVPARLRAAAERALGLRVDERRAGHRLGAARDEQIARPGANRVARPDDRREPGRAEPVHRDAGDLLGKAGEERGHARDVAVVLPRLVRGAEVDVLDLVHGNSRARDRLLDHERREIVGPLAGEHASVAPDRRANRGEDYGFRHAA